MKHTITNWPGNVARLLAVMGPLLLAACNALPRYEPGLEDVSVQLVGLGTPSMCTKGVSYSLPVLETDGLRTTKVPTGQPVVFWSSMVFDGYQVNSRCAPAVPFTPAAGQRYLVNAGLADGKCFIEVVREDLARDTGVAPEPTIGRGSCL